MLLFGIAIAVLLLVGAVAMANRCSGPSSRESLEADADAIDNGQFW